MSGPSSVLFPSPTLTATMWMNLRQSFRVNPAAFLTGCSDIDSNWKISFSVEVTPQMTTVTAERLEASLNDDCVSIVSFIVSHSFQFVLTEANSKLDATVMKGTCFGPLHDK
jgi:hypothetical protein